MANLIKYHNEVNKIPLRKFNEKELNLLFTIMYKVKDKGANEVELDFLNLKQIALTHRSDDRLINSLKKMNNKLLDLKQEITLKDGTIVMFNIFNTFKINKENKKMNVEVNKNFTYLLNDLVKEFTMFELTQLIELKSSYSKNAFRLMKQWESINKLDIELNEFKRILCIPKSYRMSEITKWVLTPIMEELSPIFKNLKLEKIKKGRSIDKLIFTWGKKGLPNSGKSLPPGGDTKVLEISEGLNRAIEKAKKNRFIKPLISEGNIEKLLNNFSDQELTKGLHFASSEIKTEIKSLNYLIKTINTGIEEKEIKIVVKKSKSNDLQGVEPKGEIKEELTKGMIEPKSEELKEFINEVDKILKNKIKGTDYFTVKGLLNSCYSFDEVNDLILKYELNTVES